MGPIERPITKLSERSKLYSISESNEQISFVPAISYLHATPTSFDNLPVPILLKTFQYLSSYDLQKNVTPVCSHWKYAATRPELWKRMCIRNKEIPRDYIMKRLRNYTDIEHLHLENVTDLNPVILQACRCLKKLKHLKLRKCSDLTNASLNYILKTHEDLETIDISKTRLEDQGMFSKFGYFKRLSHVPELTIKYLLEAVINCHFLEELKISNIKTPRVYLTDDDATFIISKLSATLKSLSIDCNSLTNIFFNALFECSKLTRLCLYAAKNITSEVLQNLWFYLPRLNEFKLRNAHHITNNDIVDLFSKNGRSKTLGQLSLLDLTGCWKLSDETVAIIVVNCPKLKSVTLKCCKTLTNMATICTLEHLTYLNMAFCLQIAVPTGDRFHLPPNFKKFVIHLNLKTIDLIHKIQKSKNEVQIYISQSEFNKYLVKYTL